ncbi:MAG: phage holin family protein [Patescibacteria group bacterium]|nr:phage holin family protein [Patescibacteria group bacterium]
MFLIFRWIVNTLALIIISYIVPGVEVRSFFAALMAALFLGIVNAIIRPILLLLTLPINILTLGLFTLVINALMFWFVASFVKGFNIMGFWPAFWAALIYWLIAWLGNVLLDESINYKQVK